MERAITDLSAMVWKRLEWYLSDLAAPQEAAAARRSALVTIPAALRGGANQRSVAGVPTAAGALRASEPLIRGHRCARLPDYHGKTIVKNDSTVAIAVLRPFNACTRSADPREILRHREVLSRRGGRSATVIRN